MIHYARHVFRHTNYDSVFILDNYELIYVLAVYYCRLRGRHNPVILEYEDGKHEIDKGYVKGITLLAEWLGKPLVRAAILAAPALAQRLPAEIPCSVVPGILNSDIVFNPAPRLGETVNFLYSGSLDTERGIPLLLDYLNSDLLSHNVCVEVTGQGKFTSELQTIANRKPDQVRYHGNVSEETLREIRQRSHYGLNLQSSNNPISNVTFPSKTFDYLNAGLRLVSTKAAGVEVVLGPAAIYLEEETQIGLGLAIDRAISALQTDSKPHLESLKSEYSLPGTARRLSELFKKAFTT
jgi:glycosyltransferase involved in cell wall biosynthesis